jgi:hypothetical protein
MAVGDELMRTTEAAERLGVTVRHFNVLVESGQIIRVGAGLVDRASVERYLASHSGGRKRVWAEHTAWGAIALLSGEQAPWLGQVQRSRLRSALRQVTETDDLLTRLRGRAQVTTCTGHRSVADRLRHDLVTVDRSRLGLVEDAAVVDGYLAADDLDNAVQRYRLREDASGAITLRATSFDLDTVRRLAHGRALGAIDAATSLDPRERGLGERALRTVLETFA